MRSPGIKKIRRIYKPIIHILALIPFILLVKGFVSQQLGANPVETITHTTGEWSLRILLITLAVTPLARITDSGWLIHFRRLIGLYCFFYVALHFFTYLLFDLSLDFAYLWEDILDRPYITVGFSAFIILLALAITSPLKIRANMGRSWARLHRLVYVAGILSVIHFLWITRVDDNEPLVYGAILFVLLGYRVVNVLKKSRVKSPFTGILPL